MDGKHVVFGKVSKGYDEVVLKMEKAGTQARPWGPSCAALQSWPQPVCNLAAMWLASAAIPGCVARPASASAARGHAVRGSFTVSISHLDIRLSQAGTPSSEVLIADCGELPPK